MIKPLKTYAFKSVAQLIENQPRSDEAAPMMTPHPLHMRADVVATDGGGTPPTAELIPVVPTPITIGALHEARKKSRTLEFWSGVGGVAYV